MTTTVQSEFLSEFVAESPLDRSGILEEVLRWSKGLAQGARVLDAGAGRAPFRELFADQQYTTVDWSNSPHPEAAAADVLSPLDKLPFDNQSFDAVLCTQVLEHIAAPQVVVDELARVLTPGGRLLLTVPFVGQLHEEPFDFYRYTKYGLQHVFETAGFKQVEIVPIGGYFTSLAQLLRDGGLSLGVEGQGDFPRRVLAAGLRAIARCLPPLDRMDKRRALPLGYACRAIR